MIITNLPQNSFKFIVGEKCLFYWELSLLIDIGTEKRINPFIHLALFMSFSKPGGLCLKF